MFGVKIHHLVVQNMRSLCVYRIQSASIFNDTLLIMSLYAWYMSKDRCQCMKNGYPKPCPLSGNGFFVALLSTGWTRQMTFLRDLEIRL